MAGSEMCSSICLDDQQWRYSVRVLGLPLGVSIDELEEFFESDAVGGPTDVICLESNSSMADITFQRAEDADKVVAKGKFYFKDTVLTVHRMNIFGTIDCDDKDESAKTADSDDSFVVIPVENENGLQKSDNVPGTPALSLLDLLRKECLINAPELDITTKIVDDVKIKNVNQSQRREYVADEKGLDQVESSGTFETEIKVSGSKCDGESTDGWTTDSEKYSAPDYSKKDTEKGTRVSEKYGAPDNCGKDTEKGTRDSEKYGVPDYGRKDPGKGTRDSEKYGVPDYGRKDPGKGTRDSEKYGVPDYGRKDPGKGTRDSEKYGVPDYGRKDKYGAPANDGKEPKMKAGGDIDRAESDSGSSECGRSSGSSGLYYSQNEDAAESSNGEEDMEWQATQGQADLQGQTSGRFSERQTESSSDIQNLLTADQRETYQLEGSHKQTIIVYDISDDLTLEDIVDYLESKVGPVSHSEELPDGESFFVALEEEKPLRFGEHKFASRTFSVRPFEGSEKVRTFGNGDHCINELQNNEETKAVVANGLPEGIEEDELEILFGSKKRGGGEVESIEVLEDDNGRNAVVTFKEPSVALTLLEQGYFMILKHRVNVTPQEARDDRIVEIVGIEDPKMEDMLLYFFENSRNGGGDIGHIEFDPRKQTFLIRFANSEVAKGLVGRSYVLQETRIRVRWPSAGSPGNEPITKVAEECGSVGKDKRKIIVHGFPNDKDLELVRGFFESPQNDGGYIESVSFNSTENTFILKFEDENVANNLIGRELSISGIPVLITCFSSSSYDLEKGSTSNENQGKGDQYHSGARPKTHLGGGGDNKRRSGVDNKRRSGGDSRRHHPRYKSVTLTLSEHEERKKISEIERTVRVKLIGKGNSVHHATLKRYVENEQRSGGGRLESFKETSSGTFEVRFIEQHAAKNFLSRQHSIQECELQVLTLASSEFVRGNRPLSDLEPRKILVRWTSGFIVTHDDLLLYITDVLQYDSGLRIIFVPKPNTALVELSQNWDVDLLSRRFMVTPFVEDGSVNITASPLLKPTCIILPKLKVDERFKIALPLYFENHAKGGDERCKVDFSGDSVLVECPSHEVAKRLTNRTHKIGDQEYTAELVYEELGVIPAEFDKNAPFVEPPPFIIVDRLGDKSKFFTSAQGQNYADVHLADLHGAICRSYSILGSVKLDCLIKKDMKEYQKVSLHWETKVKKVVENMAHSVKVCTVPSMDKTWVPLKEEVMPRLTEFLCCFELDEGKRAITLIGLEDEVNKLKTIIEEAIEKVTKDLESIIHDEDFNEIRLECLNRNGYLEKLKAASDVKVQPGATPGTLRFIGSGKEVLSASRDLRKEIESLHREDVEVSGNVAQLMKRPSFVERFITKEQLKGTLVKLTGDNKVTFVGAKHQVNKAKGVFNTSVCEVTVHFRAESKPLIGKAAWNDMTAGVIERAGKDMCSFRELLNDQRVDIACFSDVKYHIKKLFVDFFNQNTVWEERIALPEGKMQILCKQFADELKAIPEKIGGKMVSVTPYKNKGLKIKGNKDDLRKIRADIDDILRKLHSHTETVKGAGAKALKQEAGKYIRFSVEQECEVHIDIHDESMKSGYEVRKNGVTVKVLGSSMDECSADVLVDPANEDLRHGGGLAKVLADAGGPIVDSDSLYSVKVFGKVKVGEVRETSGGMLPCRVLYHTVGPRFKKGQTDPDSEKELYAATYKCLEKAGKDGHHSIALPLISAGQFGGSMHVVAKVMSRAVADFVNKDRTTRGNLSEIILIDVDKGKTDEVAKAMRMQFGGAYPKSQLVPAVAPREEATQAKSVRERIEFNTEETKNQKVEVMVNSVPEDGDLYQGPLSRSIMEVLSKKDQATIQDQVKKAGPLAEGDFVSSDGGGKWFAIYHCRVCPWDNGQGAAKACLRNLVGALLKAASESQFSSIAIPAIGTGYLGFPYKVVASTMFTTATEFLEKNANGSLRKVIFALYAKDDKAVQAFKQVFSGSNEDEAQSNDDGAVLKGKVIIGNIRFEVLEADITKEKTDCIVNGTNDKLDLQSGLVSRAIVKAAGNAVVKECQQKGRVGTNGTTMTCPGNLNIQNIRKICHLNVGHNDFDTKGNIKTCLQEAENYHLQSISFPALGTGQLKNDPRKMAGITMEAVAEFTKNNPKYVKEIRICIFDKKYVDIYHEEMQRVVMEGKKVGWRKRIKAAAESAWNRVNGSKPPSGAEGGASGVTFTSSPVEHEVDMCITYMKEEHKTEALKRIRDFCQKQEKTIIIGGSKDQDEAEMIKELDKFKEYELKSAAGKLGVSIEITKHKGIIILKGHDKDVSDMEIRIHKLLLSARADKQEEGEAELLAQFVQWQFEHNKKFEAYPQDINMLIEKAYKDKKYAVSWDEDRSGKKKRCGVVFKPLVEVDETGNQTKIRRHDLRASSIDLPSEWEKMDTTERYKLVQLKSQDAEYQQVENAFRSTVRNLKIVKIERIQNPSLYRRYAVHKQQMKTPNEKDLWHGTNPSVVPNIVANGFNRSYCGVHGVARGQGVYFAAAASTSVGYSSRNNMFVRSPNTIGQGSSIMFHAKVLVGQCVAGNSSMKEPPLIPGTTTNEHYDTTGDATGTNPSVAVVYHDTQCYPAYIVTF